MQDNASARAVMLTSTVPASQLDDLYEFPTGMLD